MNRLIQRIMMKTDAELRARRRTGYVVTLMIYEGKYYVEKNNEKVAGPFDLESDAREWKAKNEK